MEEDKLEDYSASCDGENKEMNNAPQDAETQKILDSIDELRKMVEMSADRA